MTEPTNIPTTPFDWLIDQIRSVIREELTAALAGGTNNINDTDTLLTVDEAAALLHVDPRWLYRHAAKLPFTRRISRKNLRFSEAGLRRWLAAKKPDFRR
ncbi:MAG: hypothetical protein DME76_17365 [Verrucomicrobia bacterium]|nr:MAG: hypothetical protein DME76_17365 [Verrucomicrobiota bacterium]